MLLGFRKYVFSEVTVEVTGIRTPFPLREERSVQYALKLLDTTSESDIVD